MTENTRTYYTNVYKHFIDDKLGKIYSMFTTDYNTVSQYRVLKIYNLYNLCCFVSNTYISGPFILLI